MRLKESPLLPDGELSFRYALTVWMRETASKVNQLAAGYIAGHDGTADALPAAGVWKIGDYVKKSNPMVAGGAGVQYVIKGWLRITDGTANVLNTDWLEDRALTGT